MFSSIDVLGIYLTPPAAPEIVITLPSSNFSKTSLTTSNSSLIVDFAALNFSVKKLNVYILLGLSYNIFTIAPILSVLLNFIIIKTS